eukprot:1940181-Lingulodinium_polyedra.AAC.1
MKLAERWKIFGGQRPGMSDAFHCMDSAGTHAWKAHLPCARQGGRQAMLQTSHGDRQVLVQSTPGDETGMQQASPGGGQAVLQAASYDPHGKNKACSDSDSDSDSSSTSSSSASTVAKVPL